MSKGNFNRVARRTTMRADGKTLVEHFSDNGEIIGSVRVLDLDGNDAGDIKVINRPYDDYIPQKIDSALAELNKDDDPLGISHLLEADVSRQYVYTYCEEDGLFQQRDTKGNLVSERHFTKKEFDKWVAENM